MQLQHQSHLRENVGAVKVKDEENVEMGFLDVQKIESFLLLVSGWWFVFFVIWSCI